VSAGDSDGRDVCGQNNYFTTLDTVIQDILFITVQYCCGSVGFPTVRLGLQFVLIYFVMLLRTPQAL